MNPFGGTEYTEDLVDPHDGEKWQVTLRELNAGDEAAIDDQLSFGIEDEDEHDDGSPERVDANMPMGSMRLITVTRAVVSWTLPQPATPHTIRALRKDLFHQIYGMVRFAGEKTPTTAAAAAATATSESSLEPPADPGAKSSAAATAADDRPS